MAVPKHRTSKQKKRARRSHWHLQSLFLATCSECGKKKHHHQVCQNCGFYQNKLVIADKKKKEKS